MAVEKEKLEEESVVRRFYQIILSWDYFALLKEYKATHSLHSLTSFFVFPCFNSITLSNLMLSEAEKQPEKRDCAVHTRQGEDPLQRR